MLTLYRCPADGQLFAFEPRELEYMKQLNTEPLCTNGHGAPVVLDKIELQEIK